MAWSAALLLLAGLGPTPGPPTDVRRVVVLGDSITYDGRYLNDVEATLRSVDPGRRCEFLNLGLPSETVSGLSEPGHAEGRFPRPVLRERLGRVLKATRPDLVVACYGMNDGIYAPWDEARFAAFRSGIMALRAEVAATGSRVVHLTPPPFDPVPIRPKTLPDGLDAYPRPFDGYDAVLARYSRWLVGMRSAGWDVVDIHTPLADELASRRKADPTFRLAADGVHLGDQGHRLIARSILEHWGVPPRPVEARLMGLVRRRSTILKDAWLTSTGHTRPGMPAGLPLDRARREADEIEAEIARAVAPSPGRPD